MLRSRWTILMSHLEHRLSFNIACSYPLGRSPIRFNRFSSGLLQSQICLDPARTVKFCEKL